ncbi:LysR family transcriptional regulator [Nocardiopsis baichengensis]|uniref:LysR family transcriptional regulator n=1 Tax=Nocardiopsis baichengensis TaxID=280240 RepID=UPI000344D803|nr:LysR family transcriptional regulator [Nocardiopsis baichengensis]
MIDPKLKVLQMVARHGTVTAAAQAMNYTPSAVSYQLRQLAEELGVELLAPSGRGIALTAAARIVLRHTEALSAQAERARAELASVTGEPAGPFTLCGFSTAATHLLPPAAAALRERYPQVRVRVMEAEPTPCFDLLLSGDADLALVVSTADTPSGGDERFDQRPLLDDPLDLVVPAGHRLTETARVTLADAAGEPWIVGNAGGTYHQLVMSACTSAGFTPDIAHVADEWDTGTALVALGFGIILVPRLARINDWAVVRIPLQGEPAPARRILAATRKGRRDHPVVASALEAIGSTAQTLQATRPRDEGAA